MTEPGSSYPPPPSEPPAPPPGGPPPGGAPPPTGGPPPGGGTAVAMLPWDERERHGFFGALVETVKLLVVSPAEAFGRARERGDYFSPLLFALLMIVIGTVFAVLWSVVTSAVFPPPDLTFLEELPPDLRPIMEMLMGGPSAEGLILQFLVSLAVSIVVLFVAALVLHLFLLLVGGAKQSRAGFEGTFRTVCYGEVASLALLVPFVGQLITLVWYIVLLILGLAAIHRTSHGKSAAAVLLPIGLCCVCFVVGVFMMIGAIASAFGN